MLRRDTDETDEEIKEKRALPKVSNSKSSDLGTFLEPSHKTIPHPHFDVAGVVSRIANMDFPRWFFPY